MYTPFVNIAHSPSTLSNTVTSASMSMSTSSSPSIHMPSSYYLLGISDELLRELKICKLMENIVIKLVESSFLFPHY